MLVGTVRKQDAGNTVKEEIKPANNEDFPLSPALSKLIQERNFRLSDVAIKLVSAVESEIGSTGFTPRHRINQASPSFPYNHRTMANRDSLGTGPKDQINVGKHKFYGNLSILAMLCEDLSK